MGEIAYNKANLTEISQAFLDKKTQIGKIREKMNLYISNIKANWTGDETNLAGRERDFKEILDNLNIIQSNIETIGKFLDEKNTDFSKINYK